MEARLNALEELADLLFEENDFTPSGKKFINRLISKREDFDLQSGPVSIDRKRVQTHVSHAIDLHSAGNDEQAAVELEKAIKSGLQLPAADFLIGLLTRQNDSEKALEHLQKANQDPSYALAAHLLSGEINLNKERLAEATTNYLHALMLADSETVNEDQALELIQLYEPILESQNLITQEKDMRNL
jgi:tetratricopeptide (TPR) repeat protein